MRCNIRANPSEYFSCLIRFPDKRSSKLLVLIYLSLFKYLSVPVCSVQCAMWIHISVYTCDFRVHSQSSCKCQHVKRAEAFMFLEHLGYFYVIEMTLEIEIVLVHIIHARGEQNYFFPISITTFLLLIQFQFQISIDSWDVGRHWESFSCHRYHQTLVWHLSSIVHFPLK